MFALEYYWNILELKTAALLRPKNEASVSPKPHFKTAEGGCGEKCVYSCKSVPAAKLVCAAGTGLAHSLSLSVTSGEAKPTKPL